MAAASQKSFAGHGKKKVHGALCMVIFMVLMDRSVPLMAATIHSLPGYERLTARIGEDVKIPFEFCDKDHADHRPSCTIEQTFNLSAPNSACTADRYGHCEISVAPGDHPGRQGMENICEICELTVEGVTQKDIGQYSLCRLAGCFWRTITTLEIENDVTPTSSPSPSSRPVSKTPTTAPGVSTTKNTTTEDRPDISFDPRTTEKSNNDAQIGMKSAVGIPVTLIVIVILIICGVYLYKRQSRRRQNVYYTPAVSPSTNGTSTTVNINVKNADGCSIEIDGETAHFTEDPDVNT